MHKSLKTIAQTSGTRALWLTGAALVSYVACLTPAQAQEQGTGAEQSRDSSDIVVTARKRQESILKVPVVVTAVSQEKLENLQINQVTDLPKLVPGLLIAGNLLSIGPQVSIRGVGTSSYDPGVDQSISLNVDGLSLSQGLAFGSGMFDVGQVEVMKGPQALFYGKSSPGGVISLRTADPTDKTEIQLRGGYEFEARQWRGEAIVSGPLSDTLKGRVAATYSAGDGYFRNAASVILSTGAKAPYGREPRPRNFMVRGTLLWNPESTFSARLKVNHSYDHGVDAELSQLANCPDGPGQAFGFGLPAPNALTPVDPIPFIGGDNCKLDRELQIAYMDPKSFPGIPNGGVPYLENKQDFGTLELNYDITPQLRLTSTTAYYKLNSSSLVNSFHSTIAAPTFAVTNRFHRREFTQELRLEGDFSGPLSFTAGAFFEDGQIFDRVHFIRNTAYGYTAAANAALNIDKATTVDITTYSLFGQLRYKLTDQLELAGGVRWTDEERKESVFDYNANSDYTSTLPRPRIHSSNFSPEFTLTYTPTDDLTFFGSYKKGYKSGSFKLAVPAAAGENNAFDDERVQGGEIGLKSRLADRTVLFNLAGYYYEYKGLQVGGIEPAPNGVPLIKTVNAGRAVTYGIDADLAWRPAQIEGLGLNLSVNWNHARYKELNNIPCYANQTISMGCVNFPNPNTLDPGTGKPRFTGQELSDTPMVRAPQWSVNAGFDYEMPVGSGMKLRLSNNNQISSRYVTYPAVGRPDEDNYQRGFVKVDASIALKDADDRWEVALIGKNITDKITAANCSATNFAGGLGLGGDNSGGVSRSASGYSESACYSDPGRSVWVRLTWRPR